MIFKWEEKLLKWMTENLLWLALIAATVASLAIRYLLRGFLSGDMESCLLPWYEAIKANGGIKGLATPIEGCNYSFAYQLCIAILTYLPIEAKVAYKLLSGIFDYLLGYAIASLVYETADNDKLVKAIVAFILVIMSPLVFLNSAAWAQCDSIYTFFAIMAVLMLIKEKYLPAFIFYGVSFAFKFQAVFLMPFFLFYYLYKKKFSVIYFLCIPVCMTVLSLPALVQGRSPLEIITIYTDNTSLHQSMSNNYPSFWRILNDGTVVDGYETMKYVAMVFTVVVLGCYMYLWIHNNIKLTPRNTLFMAFVLTYTTVAFLPAMHERYGFAYEAMGIAIILLCMKTIALYLALFCTSFITYGAFLFHRTFSESNIAIAAFAIYVLYMIVVNREMLKENG